MSIWDEEKGDDDFGVYGIPREFLGIGMGMILLLGDVCR